MTHDASYSYAWNAENELTGFGGTSYYTYDGDHKRVENSYNGYYYWYSPDGLPLAETNSSGTTQNEYIYFNGARVARRDSSGNVYYYFSDHVGTAQMLTNSTGTVCYDSDNTPFGYVMAYTTTCPQNYQLAGMELDGGTGNYQTWFRFYEPNLGRWMSPDLVAGDVTNPQSLNRYAYVLNNPASLVDPLGLDAGDACEASAAQFGWFDCPNGSGGAGLGSGGLGGGIGIDPSLCFDDPYPDPSCGMPGGMGGGGGGGGFPGRSSGNADLPNGSTVCSVIIFDNPDGCTTTQFPQPPPWWAQLLNRPWQLSWILPVADILPDVGAGPAGSIAYNPPTHNLCISAGIGVSAGHNVSIGPLAGYSLSGAPLTPQEIDNVLSGWSVSFGANVPTGPVPVGPGGAVSVNGSGVLGGPTVGVAGGSASWTTAACQEVHF